MVEGTPLKALPATATESEKDAQYTQLLQRLKLILEGFACAFPSL
jgi:hypothetical protein